jgi:hypothetical protein
MLVEECPDLVKDPAWRRHTKVPSGLAGSHPFAVGGRMSDPRRHRVQVHDVMPEQEFAGHPSLFAFFASLKAKRVVRKVYRTRDAAKADVFNCIERFYNPRRRHSVIGHLSPIEFQQAAQVAKHYVHQTGSSSILAAPLLWAAPSQAQGATAGYHVAMKKMNREMAAEAPSGNADRDFASMMAKHHQAAIDMARVELEHGREPEMPKVAEEIVQKQQQEIAQLRTWLSRQPAK